MAGWPPEKNAAFTWYFFIRDADGDPVTGATNLDVEYSIDGGAFSDVAGTETEEGEGMYSCAISNTEMNGDVIGLICKTDAAGAKTAAQVIYTSTRQIDDLAYPATSGRSIQVETDGHIHADLKEWLGVAPNALVSSRVDASVGAMAADTITSSAIAANAITSSEIQDGAVTNAKLAANTIGSTTIANAAITDAKINIGAITSAKFAAGAIDAAALATDAAQEIRDEILSDSTPFAGANIDAAISSRSDFDETTDPVELLDSGGTAGTSADELVDDLWDEAKAGHVGVGSFGEEVQSHATQAEILSDATPFAGANIDATISSRGTADPGDAMDLIADALDSTSLAATATNEIRDSILSDSTPFAGADISAILSNQGTPGSDGLAGEHQDILDAIAGISGGVADWTSGEKEQIRDALGVDGTKTAATGGDIQDISSRIPAALVSGRMDADVGAIQANAITASSIQANALTAAKFAAQFITNTKFAAGAVDANALGADCLTSAKIADDAIANEHLAADCIAAAQLSGSVLTSAKFATDALTATGLATSAAQKIRDEIINDATTFSGANIEQYVGIPNSGQEQTLFDALDVPQDCNVISITTNAVRSIRGYDGPRGPGVYYTEDSAGSSNTQLGVDGIQTNPVNDLAAAVTLASATHVGTKRIYVVDASTLTLDASFEEYEFVGIGDLAVNSVNLNSQNVAGSSFYNLLIQGAQGAGGRMSCFGGAFFATNVQAYVYQAAIVGNISLQAGVDSFFDSCWSSVAGNGTPELTFAANADVSWRHYSGGLQINSMAATNTMSYETDGQMVIDATCTGGNLTMRGNMTLTDNAGGAVTVTDDARIDVDQIQDAILSDSTTFAGADVASILSNQGTPGSNGLAGDIADVQTTADAILVDTGTTLPGILGTPVGADLSADIAAVQADTDDIQTRLPASLVGGRMDCDVGNMQSGVVDPAAVGTGAIDADALATDAVNEIRDAILSDSTSFAGADIADILSNQGTPGSNGLAGDIADLEPFITQEISDALTVDTISELSQAAPAATPTIHTALMLLYMALRNKIDIDANWKEIHADDGTMIARKALTDDATTYSEAEMEIGV